MGTVTVHFGGACTHFRGVVPGVPHRVVMVDASAIHIGVLERKTEDARAWPATPQRYVLFPHAVSVAIDDAEVQKKLTVVGAMDEGMLYAGAHLQIANASPSRGVEYDDEFEQKIPRLTAYADDYQYSPEVVLAGKGASYFDVFSGKVGFETFGRSLHARITIKTTSRPILRITPFQPTRPVEVELPDSAELHVANLDVVHGGTTHLDFLLHFLTARDGLPRHVKQKPFGADEPRPISGDYGSDLTRLLNTDWPRTGRPLTDMRIMKDPDVGTAASCSDSQYP